MTFLPHFSGALARGPIRHVVAVTAVILCGVAGLAGCGKTISIGDAAPASPAASSPPASSASSAVAAPGAGNTALQVVDTTAEDAGLTGSGGTVVGLAVQKTPPKWVQLSAVTSPQLSTPYLININQAALYRFDGDNGDPTHSHCDDACAAKWPPVTIRQSGNVYLAGVDRDEVGAIRRADGQVQITVGGMPVYRFAGDTKPGDLNGQGVGRTWFTVGPKGQRVTD